MPSPIKLKEAIEKDLDYLEKDIITRQTPPTHLTSRARLLTTFNTLWKIQVQADALQIQNEPDVFQLKLNIIMEQCPINTMMN